jgi:hypothetical protein
MKHIKKKTLNEVDLCSGYKVNLPENLTINPEWLRSLDYSKVKNSHAYLINEDGHATRAFFIIIMELSVLSLLPIRY